MIGFAIMWLLCYLVVGWLATNLAAADKNKLLL